MKNIVTLGGGTGQYTLLLGLKKYPASIAAIVSMADDGGSTGRLRDELGVLPPGDVRKCLVALSHASRELRELMNYRFTEGSLKGHNFGNIFVSALEKTSESFVEGVQKAEKILDTKGTVIPVTEEDMRLRMTLENGEKVFGEEALDENTSIRKSGIAVTDITLTKPVQATKKALKKIEEADILILGPGDHFGSILPNLLLPEIAKAIQKSQGKVVYVSSLTNKRGLTEGWTVEKYITSLENYIGKNRIDKVIINNGKPDAECIRKYEEKEGKNSLVEWKEKDGRYIFGDILASTQQESIKGDTIAHTRSFIRHDSDALAKIIMKSL